MSLSWGWNFKYFLKKFIYAYLPAQLQLQAENKIEIKKWPER